MEQVPYVDATGAKNWAQAVYNFRWVPQTDPFGVVHKIIDYPGEWLLDLPLPDLSGVSIVAQPHCHHASVLGWQADATLLAATGAIVTTLGGC